MARFGGQSVSIVTHAKLVGACILAGFVGVALAMLAAVIAGRTATSQAAAEPPPAWVGMQAVTPPMVTFNRRRDRLDQAYGSKTDFLSDVMTPVDNSHRRLKTATTVVTMAERPEPVETLRRDLSQTVTALLPGEVPERSVTGLVGTGPIALISPAMEAAISDAAKRKQGNWVSQRPSRALGGVMASTLGGTAGSSSVGGIVAGGSGSVSGLAGRATGALGL
jgi:hypothetical protein